MRYFMPQADFTPPGLPAAHLVFREEGRVISSWLPGERGQEVAIRHTYEGIQGPFIAVMQLTAL